MSAITRVSSDGGMSLTQGAYSFRATLPYYVFEDAKRPQENEEAEKKGYNNHR
jgi:hypothetical protein